MNFEEYKEKRSEILERMIWVGAGTKKQAEEGFRLMTELIQLDHELLKTNSELFMSKKCRHKTKFLFGKIKGNTVYIISKCKRKGCLAVETRTYELEKKG